MFDYYGSKWKKKREHILKLDGYKCRVAKMYGKTEAELIQCIIYIQQMNIRNMHGVIGILSVYHRQVITN